MTPPKYKKGDRVLVSANVEIKRSNPVDKRLKGTILSSERIGMYLVKLDEIEESGQFGGYHFFTENEIHPLENKEFIFELEQLPINEEELEKFSLDMHFTLICWKIDNLLDQYNLTGDKEIFKKIKEMTVSK